MTQYTLHTCPICEQPIEVTKHGKVLDRRSRKEGCKIELGFSRGGWGFRQDWLNFSGEICGECFDEVGRLLEPAVSFVRSGGGRKSDNISPVWSNEPSPSRREISVLRALLPFHR